ncbi:hypothetical protein AAMO2058_001207600 [Amorphochlora amoebiformis]
MAGNEKQLNEVLRLLAMSLKADNERQAEVFKEIISLKKNEDFNRCLAIILCSAKSQPDAIRTAAGVLLKNSIRSNYHKMSTPTRNFIKNKVLQAVGDEKKEIRKTAALIACQTASEDKLNGWEKVLHHLVKMLDSPSYNDVDGAFNTLQKICEDEKSRLDSAELGRPLNILIPKFLTFFVHPKVEFRAYAVGSVNLFLQIMPQALRVNMKDYLKGLGILTNDKSFIIRKLVCQAFVSLVLQDLNTILPHIKQVIEFMLKATAESKEEVAREACEFWPILCEAHHTKGLDSKILKSYLPVLVPILLKGMIYSSLHLVYLGGDEDIEDSHIPDRKQDIAPRHHGPKVTKFYGANGDADTWDDDDEDESYWNLRKCSASSLDTLATDYKDDLLPFLLPLLRKSLDSKQTDWKITEAGILALGAVAEGCFKGISQHLNQLIPFLISLLKHPKPLVRSITCWTLSRYSKWVIHTDPNDEKFFKPLMVQLLQSIQDKNKRVQEAACSAFATLEEEAQERLIPYLEPILKNLMFALQRYQAKNLLVLYDAIGTLAESVGPALGRKELLKILMPPLMSKWQQLNDGDRNIFPLLECLTSIAQSIRGGFLPFAAPVFSRCLKIIHKTLVHMKQMGRSAMENDSTKEFIVCSLDLLSGLVEGLGSSIESLVANSDCLALLYECLRDPDPDVRQSAFGLLGDLGKACIGHIKPHLHKFMPVTISNITFDNNSASLCNNASWALGEIALRVGGDMSEFMPGILEKLVSLIKNPSAPKSLLENAAITLGRVGLVCPEIVAKHLHHFAKQWCKNLLHFHDSDEREHAFRGLCSVIHKNPRGIVEAIPELVDALARYYNPSQQMALVFHGILAGLKKMLGDKWRDYFGRCDKHAYDFVSNRYRI